MSLILKNNIYYFSRLEKIKILRFFLISSHMALNGGLTFFHRSYNNALLYYFYFPLVMTRLVIIKIERSGNTKMVRYR